ncbi:Lsr2 protein [Streptomyces sp. 3213]|uniref:Lsr2 family DNA-binding protein n=1 Tax=Streptomyces sp. 3213.3 TaxID=1855348 RepID=UPI00089D0348|nr:histone-like nucleoid-structuring protein Lsr2 [Streptomyces sp. 3213.3]SED34417.1 Lsr2 protein [Streptomyces sp. 3213] [Streptomyces sp. 3213.3]
MALSVFNSTRADGWSVPIPWWQDSNGKPNTWCGKRPSWHGMIFYVAAVGPTRAALNGIAPADPIWYVVAYGACLAIGLLLGRLIRIKANDEFSRKCSGILGFVGVTATGLVVANSTAHAPAAAQAMAGYAPVAAGVFLLLFTLGGAVLSRFFPHCAGPSARQLEARIEELTRQLDETRQQHTALRRAPVPEPLGHDPKVVRAWARGSGYTVPARGRIPAHILEAWRTAGRPTA